MSFESVNPDDLAADAVSPVETNREAEAFPTAAAPAAAAAKGTPAPAHTLGWAGVTVAILFAVLYAYDLWEGISTLVSLPAYYSALGLDVGPVWWILIVGVLLPVLVYGIAFLVGLRQKLLGKVLVFLVGLSVVSALSLGLIALEQILRPTLLGI